jgi:hypothetical protein
MCKILVAPKSYFASIKAPTAHSTAGQSKEITTTHTFNSGKGFIAFDGYVRQKGTGKGSTVGDVGSKTMKYEISAPVAGMNSELLEFIEGGLNEDFIVLAADGCQCGIDGQEYLQFGCENNPAILSADSDLGTIEGGFKGNTLKFEAFGVPNVYSGSVVLMS